MIAIQIFFSDGSFINTQFNGSLCEAEAYYVGRFFEFDENKPQVKGVSVKLLS